MRGVVCTDFGESTVKELHRPEPGPGEVLVAVDRVQLSVTECQLYRGEEVAHYETVTDRLEGDEARLFGHEFCGRVVELGEGVSSFGTGDRVYAPGKIPCGECPYCRRGHPHLCERQKGIGYDRPGALAEYVALPVEPLCRLPEGVSDAAGAALQPMASALLCAIDARIEPGDAVAAVGAGAMGYAVGQIASRLGAGDVFAIDLREEPLRLSADRGMRPIDAREGEPAARVREATGGIGADVVFEAAGGDQARATEGTDPLATAHSIARRGGTVVQVGHIAGDVTWTPRRTRSKMLDWVNPRKGSVPLGPNATSGELAARLAAGGSVSVEEYVTHELSGLETFERAVEITLEKDEYDALGPAQIVV